MSGVYRRAFPPPAFRRGAHRPLLAEEFRARAQRSIARDLIVFGGLSGRQNAGVPHCLVIDLVYHFLPFRYDAEDRIAGLAAGLLVDGGFLPGVPLGCLVI